MDFDKPKVYGDTSINDGLVFFIDVFPNAARLKVDYVDFYHLAFN